MNLGARDLCANVQQNCGTDFQYFDFKILKFLANIFSRAPLTRQASCLNHFFCQIKYDFDETWSERYTDKGATERF